MNIETLTNAFLADPFACPYCHHRDGIRPTSDRFGQWSWTCPACGRWWTADYVLTSMSLQTKKEAVAAGSTDLDLCISAQKRTQYKADPHVCPYCGDRVTTMSEDLRGKTATIVAQCLACRKEWSLTYTFRQLV